MNDEGTQDPGREAGRKTLNDRLAESAYAIATGLGAGMVIAGTVLAAAERPESALIWAGTVIAGVGLVGDRLLKFQVGREGALIELQEKQKKIGEVVEKAKETAAPKVGTTPMADLVGTIPIAGNYWSDRAVSSLFTAFGSNTRSEFNRALADLDEMAAQGTAVVNLEPSESAPQAG